MRQTQSQARSHQGHGQSARTEVVINRTYFFQPHRYYRHRYLTYRGRIEAATTFMKKFRLIFNETKSDLKDDSNDIESIIQSNEATDQEKSLAPTLAVQNAADDMVVNDVPRRSDLAAQMQKQLQNWVVSAVLTTIGCDMVVDTAELADDLANPSGLCKAENGFTIGANCALFRIGGTDFKGNVIADGTKGNNIFAL
ncbi:uncharacterized protein A1O9_02423 [Exophiala aquamarina CBS 119918]|uniref:Uncharacterized protein n=1 Tax=Exophiala aquamarina CBS 119918 TaxID=1182545 RepID=A0A072PLW9_9EURO|nr:uncharacterized protein A1O9_02423 [Exophiala aquamarina CBS 119918]KEF60861.1 hypothetical protein A1O9_02423 [Exophiala aquamarina CBS 119918]